MPKKKAVGTEKKKTLALVSLGCAKNAVDLQNRVGALLKNEYILSRDPDRADTVLINTCAFIESARKEAEAEIVRAIQLKSKGNYNKIIVAGCYPQRYPAALARFPGVDEWLGVPKDWQKPSIPGLRFTGKAYAYLKIAEGCSHRCAYCAIPAIRGRFRSRPEADIIAEARALLKSGCRELNIVAQDPMLWRGENKRKLPDLLWKLDSLKGDFWIRVLYSYPNEITEEFVEWMNLARHAVKYIDVPLQHTVPEVLEKMNRARAIAASREAPFVLREVIPGVTLRTTIMVGFPGETEARFKWLLSDLRRMQFDRLGVFAYSPEEGTIGAQMRGRPSKAIALKREKAVARLASDIWEKKALRPVGSRFKALVIASGVARMESQAPEVDGVVYLDSDAVGEFVEVELVSVKGCDFDGRVVS